MTAIYWVDYETYNKILICNGKTLVFSPAGRFLGEGACTSSAVQEVNIISCIQRNGKAEIGRLVNREFTKASMTEADALKYCRQLERDLKQLNGVNLFEVLSFRNQVSPDISVLQTLYVFK